MIHVRRQHNPRLYAAVAPTALFLMTATPTTSSGWQGRQRQEKATQWAAAHPHGGARDDNLDRHRRVDDALGEKARDGSLDGRERAGGAPCGDGQVDEGHGLYRRRSSPSPDRTMVIAGFKPLLGTSVPTVGGLPSPRPTTSSGPR
jgi:hypothetical protein